MTPPMHLWRGASQSAPRAIQCPSWASAKKKTKNMAKNSKPRKIYRPKPVNVPVTQGLLDSLAQDMHFALMGMESNDDSPDNWKRLGRVICITSIASDDNDRVGRSDNILVDSAVLTLQAISDREVRTGRWHVTDLDRTALTNGAVAAERVLPLLDYRRLNAACATVEALAKHV